MWRLLIGALLCITPLNAQLNMTIETPTLVVHAGKDAIWPITIQSASPVRIEPGFAHSQYAASCAHKEKEVYKCTVTFSAVKESDSNQYEFVAVNKLARKPFTLMLVALAEFKYKIVDLPEMYPKGSVTDPLCLPDGPVTSEVGKQIRESGGVTWRWFECDSGDCTAENEVPISTVSSGTLAEDRGALTYTLKEFAPKKSGVLSCIGINSDGNKITTSKKITISEQTSEEQQ